MCLTSKTMQFTHWLHLVISYLLWYSGLKIVFFFSPPDIFETAREKCQLKPQRVHCQNEPNWSGRIGESQRHQCQRSTIAGRCQHQSLAPCPRERYQCAGCPEGKCIALIHLLADAEAYQKQRNKDGNCFFLSFYQYKKSQENSAKYALVSQ